MYWFQGYPAPHDEILKYISGFSGTNGKAPFIQGTHDKTLINKNKIYK